MHSSLLMCNYLRLKHPKDKSQNKQNRGSSELSSGLFETYKHYLKPHGCQIYNSAADMDMEKCVPVSENIMG